HSRAHCSFFISIPRAPRPTLFPYTTLFRSYPQNTADVVASINNIRLVLHDYTLDERPVASPRPVEALVSETDDASAAPPPGAARSEEHTSELQSLTNLVCRLLLETTQQSIA